MRWGTIAATLGCAALMAACGKGGEAPSGDKKAAAEKPAAEKPAAEPAGLPKSLDALVDRGLVALKAGDEASFAKLMIKVAAAKKLCPGRTEGKDDRLAKEFARERTKMGERFSGECGAVDWKRAKLVSRTGGKARKADDRCPGVTRFEDVKLHFDVGGTYVQVELEDPIGREGTTDWYFSGAPDCDKREGPAPVAWPEAKKQLMKLAETFNTEVCACTEAACGTKKVEAYMTATSTIARQHRPPESETKELLTLQEKGLACLKKLKEANAAKPE